MPFWKAQEGLFGRPFSGFARFSPRRAYYAYGQTPASPSIPSLGRLLCCHARHDARPQFYGVKALAASATGGHGRYLLPCASMARATPLCAKALAANRSVASTVPAPPARHGLTPRRLEPQHTPCEHYSTLSSDGRYIPHTENRSEAKIKRFHCGRLTSGRQGATPVRRRRPRNHCARR